MLRRTPTRIGLTPAETQEYEQLKKEERRRNNPKPKQPTGEQARKPDIKGKKERIGA